MDNMIQKTSGHWGLNHYILMTFHCVHQRNYQERIRSVITEVRSILFVDRIPKRETLSFDGILDDGFKKNLPPLLLYQWAINGNHNSNPDYSFYWMMSINYSLFVFRGQIRSKALLAKTNAKTATDVVASIKTILIQRNGVT